MLAHPVLPNMGAIQPNFADRQVTMTQENYLKSELYAAMRTDTRFFDFLEQASLDGI